MLISANFVPTNFDIVDFYGDETCFAWSEDKIVVFPYLEDLEDLESVATRQLSTIVAPRNVRCLRSFNGRVFVLCQPAGIYKLLRTRKFSALSSTGITSGPVFYHVFTPENNWLHSQNKSTKVNRRLFRLDAPSDGSYRSRDITVDKKNSESALRRAIDCADVPRDRDITILADNKRLFKITLDDVRLVYRGQRDIVDIVPILRGEIIAGVVLVTFDAAILVYVVRGKLKFHKVYLDGEVADLCAGMSLESDNSIWLAHIDGRRIHYWSKTASEKTFRRIKTEPGKFLRVKNYKNNFVICLSDTARLVRYSLDSLRSGRRTDDEFVRLDSNMFNGTDRIVDAICERAKELQRWNETLLRRLDEQKRINIYSQKQRIVHLPAVSVRRMAGRLYATVKFHCVLPANCYIVVGLISNRRDNYRIKMIQDSEITLDLSLDEDEKFHDKTRIRVDLVTRAQRSKTWCLIRNYTENPKNANAPISNDRIKFLNAKLEGLRNLTDQPDGSVMKKLSAIKKTIRG